MQYQLTGKMAHIHPYFYKQTRNQPCSEQSLRLILAPFSALGCFLTKNQNWNCAGKIGENTNEQQFIYLTKNGWWVDGHGPNRPFSRGRGKQETKLFKFPSTNYLVSRLVSGKEAALLMIFAIALDNGLVPS